MYEKAHFPSDGPAHKSTRAVQIRSIIAGCMRAFIGGVTDLAYPVICTGCGSRLLDTRYPVCTRCLPQLERVNPHTAATALAGLQQHHESFSFVLPLWTFDKAGTVQRIHKALKYSNKPALGSRLGHLMGELLITPLPLDQHPTLIVPIPLHRKRYLERGYNQSTQLARGLAKATHIPLSTTILQRNRYTATQTGHDARARQKNVAGAFSIASGQTPAVSRYHVLLVDDVLTTGATLLAAAHPLREAGVKQISVATLAFARI